MLHSTYKFTYLENTPYPFYEGRSNCTWRNEAIWISKVFIAAKTTAWIATDRPQNKLWISSYTNNNESSVTTYTIIDIFRPHIWFDSLHLFNFQIQLIWAEIYILACGVQEFRCDRGCHGHVSGNKHAEFSGWVKTSAQKVQYYAPRRRYIEVPEEGTTLSF